MSDRTCLDCGTDISARHWRSKRCQPCQFERERYAMNHKSPARTSQLCAVCGRTFMAPKGTRACSARCTGLLGHPGTVTRQCLVCDREFTISKQYDKLTCSKACTRWHERFPSRKPQRQCRWCGGSLEGKSLRVEWCDDRCWHAEHEGVSWEAIKNRKCAVCGNPIPRSLHYARTVCSAQCRTRNRSLEVLFRQAHARRRNMDAAKVHRVSKSYIRMLRRMPCFYCGRAGGTADHVVPISRGGKHSEGNLVPACRPCNSSKGNLFVVEWRRIKGVRNGTRYAAPPCSAEVLE